MPPWFRRVVEARYWDLLRFVHAATPRRFWIAGLGTAGGALLPVVFAVLTGRLIDAAVNGVDRDALYSALMLFAGATLLNQILGPLTEWATALIRSDTDLHIRRRLVTLALRPATIAHLESPVFRDRIATVQGVTANGNSLSLASSAVFQLMSPWLTAISFAIVLASFRWYLPLLMLLTGVVVRRLLRRHLQYMTDGMVGQAQHLRKVTYLAGLGLRPEAAKEVRVFGFGDWLTSTYREQWDDAMRTAWRERRNLRLSLMLLASLLVMTLLLAGVILTVGATAFSGTLTVGELSVLVSAAMSLMYGFLGFNQASVQVEFGVKGLPALLELEEQAASADVPGGALPAAALPREAIRFEDVCFRYPETERDIYAGLSLEIPAGQSLAVVGVNGAGKTTLVKLLARLYDPTSGRITVDGIPLRDIDVDAWQCAVAAIFQDFVRYPVSARDNIAYGALDVLADEAAIRAVAELAGVLDVLDDLPAGLDTVLDRRYEGGAELSGGQWQRVALARALLAVRAGAGVLVLDEPTASLDARSEAEMFDRFLEITAGVTTVIISHRFSTVRRATRIAVLDEGRVVELGNHEELMAAGGHYAHMFRMQSARFDEPPEDSGAAQPVVSA